MDRATHQALDQLNRRFYDECSDQFDAKRQRSWAGWSVWFDQLGLARGASVLDLGCGNGRFARFLAERGEYPYCGIDRSAGLLAAGRQRSVAGDAPTGASREWIEADLLATDWSSVVGDRTFDLVVLLAVLHHVPSVESRNELIGKAAAHVAPGGALVCSIWQLSAVLRRNRVIDWKDARSSLGEEIDERQLDAEDFLVRWGAGGGVARYCRRVRDEEVVGAFRSAGLTRLQWYDARAEGEDNRYVIARG